ncbi:UMP kinase [Candidatus Micrarchaeota archaeon]|nr:UMP kinase [Candidatus Micrarchaeota archaeon]
MKTTVISLGGSLLEGGYAKSFAALLKPILSKTKFAIVTGGGQKAGAYAETARQKTESEFWADEAAIKATRENAGALITAFGTNAWPNVLTYPTQVVAALKQKKVAVSGGFLPGITTDACAVLLAEALGAKRIVNVSKVDGIYDKDPKKFKEAKRFDIISHAELLRLASQYDDRKARTNFLFDVVAAKLCARSNIQVDFVSGLDLSGVANAVQGKPFSGTKVR